MKKRAKHAKFELILIKLIKNFRFDEYTDVISSPYYQDIRSYVPLKLAKFFFKLSDCRETS